MIGELSNNYVSYLKVDITKALDPLIDTMDDMLTRLEEFEGLVSMVQVSGSQYLQSIVPDVLLYAENLQLLCDRVDSLETFVQQVHHDLDIIESQMNIAEANIGCAEGKLKNFLKPLFFKHTDSATRNTKTTSYTPPVIFDTSNYFLPDNTTETKQSDK